MEVVEYMLWLAPQAESISIRRNVDPFGMETVTALKLIYNEKNAPCCKLLPSGCWRHSSTEINIEKFEGDDNERTEIINFFHKVDENLKIVETFSTSSFYDGVYTFYDQLFTDEDEDEDEDDVDERWCY